MSALEAQCLEDILPHPPLLPDGYFGHEVVASGGRLLVTHPGDNPFGPNSGSVHLYELTAGGNWQLDTTLHALHAGPAHSFGISADLLGDLLVVGASGEQFLPGPGLGGEYIAGDFAGYQVGGVYVFENLQGSWVQRDWLRSNEPGSYHRFGYQVAVEVDSILISEPGFGVAGEDGALCHFVRGAQGWILDQRILPSLPDSHFYGGELARDGDTAFTSAFGFPTEKVFVYERRASGWSEVARFENNYQGGLYDFFGNAMAIDGHTAVIGAFYAEVAGPSFSGAAYIVERLAGTWQITQTLLAPDAEQDDHFGYSVDIQGDWVLVGARYEGSGSEGFRGATYRFRRTPAGFEFADKWLTQNGDNTGFGYSVRLAGDEAYVTGMSNLPAGFNSGRVTRIEFPAAAVPYCACPAGAACANPDGLAGCANSTGSGATLQPCGSTSVALDDLTLQAAPLPSGQVAYLFMGGAENLAGLGDGQRCIAPGPQGLFRFTPQPTGTGSLQLGPGLVAESTALFGAQGTLSAGSTWHFQVWYRDPAGPCGSGSNLSSAVAVTFGP